VENVLAGFHSQWFFFILADVGGLLLLHAARAFALRWWIAATLLCASYLCMASGVFGVAAGAGLCLAQWMLGRRSGAREVVAILVLAAIAVALLLDIPTLPYHQALKADSVGSFVTALLKIG